MFNEMKPIHRYTQKQAEDDGILVNVKNMISNVSDGVISHATTNLLYKGGYMRDDKTDIPAIMSLLHQAETIITLQKIIDGRQADWFYSGDIKAPNGKKIRIFIEQNETWYYTLMLPEDH